nr:GTPase IMAP family member 7-like isoform X2 [Salvelinus alpinus]
MGNINSTQNDSERAPLLDDTDEGVILDNLRLVLIGDMGKNDAGNTIMGQNHFSWFNTFFKKTHIKKENQIQNRHITLVRTPGSFSHLDSSSNQIKTDTIHCVQSLFCPGPHAILLVIQLPVSSEDSKFIRTTGNEMNTLFTQDVWKHTLVLFTRGEKMQPGHTIQDYISGHGLAEIVEQCGKEPFVLYGTKKVKNQSIELIKTVEEMVAENEHIYFMTQDKNMVPQGSQEAKNILENLKNKVDHLEEYTNALSRLMQLAKSQDKLKSYENTIKMKNDEIKRLRVIIRKKDILLESFVAGVGQTECPACQLKDLQIQHLEEENNRYRAELSALKNTTDNVSEEDTPELGDHRRQPFLRAEAGRNHQNETPSCVGMNCLSSCGFITKHRMALETRLGRLDGILSYLHAQKVLDDEEREEVVNQPTKSRTKQNQTLLDMVVRKGDHAQEHFYHVLKEKDPYLVKDLEEKKSRPEQAGV